ncbi:resolvase [Synechococcus sp. M16CYN]|uniref:resolvase n=1 Tax=Synechococcus sp. M16CYN TaxID=3103139 RepID=UPI0032490B95
MNLLIALDPGRSKCGLILVDYRQSRVLAGHVVLPTAVLKLVNKWARHQLLDRIIIGNGTGGTQWIRAFTGLAKIHRVNEYGTTLRARRRYWELWPPKGWQRLLPTGLRLPPKELDAIAALVMLEDHLGYRCAWPGPPPDFSLKTWPEL